MLKFSFFEPRDLAVQRELFRLSFPETRGSGLDDEAHYRWKFHSFPSNPASYETAGFDEKEIVGYYAALPYEYRFQGQRVTAGMVCDVMTHPERRGQGIFTKIGRFATDELQKAGVDFTTGYPIRPEVIPGHLKVGWRVAFRLPMYIKFLKTNAALRSKNLGWAAPVGNLGATLYRTLREFWFRPNAEYRVDVLSRDSVLSLSDWEAFVKRWQSQVPIALEKTKEFLAWRTAAPGTKYHFVTARRGETITGFVLARATELQGIPVLALLDEMVTEPACLPNLYQHLTRLAFQEDREAICGMFSPRWAKFYRLSSFGFLRSPFAFSLIIKQLSGRIPDAELFNERNWHLMWVDSDDL